MEFYGEIVFVVADSKCIDSNLGLELLPTKIINKGDMIALGKRAHQNRWLHSIEFNGQNEYLQKLNQLINHLYEKKECINQLMEQYEMVSVDIYIRSDFAQIGYSLPSYIIKKIAVMECNINFEILSFGMANNEGVLENNG